jgi:hypothetical protein
MSFQNRLTDSSIALFIQGINIRLQVLLDETRSPMIPYLGSDFVRALLGLSACDETAVGPLGAKARTPPVSHEEADAQGDERRITAHGLTTQSGDNISTDVHHKTTNPRNIITL